MMPITKRHQILHIQSEFRVSFDWFNVMDHFSWSNLSFFNTHLTNRILCNFKKPHLSPSSIVPSFSRISSILVVLFLEPLIIGGTFRTASFIAIDQVATDRSPGASTWAWSFGLARHSIPLK